MPDPVCNSNLFCCPAADQDHDPLPQTAGQGAAVTYDTFRRWQYTTQIKLNSNQALALIEQARLAGDLSAAEAAALNASIARNTVRTTTQGQLLPGGRVLSTMLEQDRSWNAILQKYNPTGQADFDTWQRIAAASGRSSKDMLMFSRVSRVLGPAGIIFGAGVAAHEVSCAPPEQRARVASQETGGIVGGLALGTLGTAGGALLVGALVSNPAGWVVLGGAVVVGGIAGWLGSEGGRSVGGAIYDFFAG
jgi:hypothetical protein